MEIVDLANGQRVALRVVRWTARVWATLMLLALGAFFLEHLGWFTHRGAPPPGRVWWLMALHLVLLIGLAIGWRWELPGAMMVLISAPLFFFNTAGQYALAYSVLTMVPGVLWLVCGVLSKRGVTTSPPF
ncbi:MAG: hypothetical protein AB7I30_16180 [Isosphaeraceae bacterium]